MAFFDRAMAPRDRRAVFLLDDVFDIRTFENFPGLRQVQRDLISRLSSSPAGFVLASRFTARAHRILRDAPARFEVVHIPPLSVPDVEMRCPRCRGKLRQWARFCTQCGLDVSGEAPASGEHASRAALREKVRAATADQYEFLGDIGRAEGGGLVYFARDLADGKIVALRLQKDLNKKFAVGVTRTLKAVESEDAVASKAAASPRAAVTIIQRTPLSGGGVTATAARPQAVTPPVAPPAASTPNESSPAAATPKWKVGRAEIAAGIAVVLIILLILTQL